MNCHESSGQFCWAATGFVVAILRPSWKTCSSSTSGRYPIEEWSRCSLAVSTR